MNIKQTIITATVALTMVAMIAPMTVGAMTAAEMQAQINSLQAQLSALNQGGMPAACVGVTFTRYLRVGSTGSDVRCLQALLNTSASTRVSATGAGSPGMETTYFGVRTLAAVRIWQVQQGWVPANQVGPLSMAKLNAWLAGSTPSPTPTPTPTPTPGPVSVALSATTPAAGVVVDGQATADLLHVTFTGTGTVTSVKLKRMGVSDQNTLTNVYLYDGNTRITDGYAFNINGEITINGLSIAVAGSKEISVRGDAASNASSTSSTISVGVIAFTANSVTNNANVWGNTMAVVVGNLATAFLGVNTVASASVNAGTTAYTFWSAPLQVNVRSLWLKGANFRMIGSAPSDALGNVRLFIDGVDTGKVGAIMMIQGSSYVVFDLTAAPINLATGSHTLDVRANIEKGSNRTVQVSLQQAADLTLTDPQVGVNIAVRGPAGVTFSSNNAGTITINTGSATVVIDPAFQTMTNIAGGTTNAVIGKFKVHAYGEDVKVNTLSVTPVLTGTTPAQAGGCPATGSANGLNNVTLYFNGSQVGTQQTWCSGALTYNLGSQLIVPAGVDSWLEVRADLQNNANANYTAGTVSATLNMGSSNAQGMSSLATSNFPTANVVGTSLTIQTGLLSVSKNSGYLSQAASPNTAGVKLGSFIIQNQSTSESVRLTNLAVALTYGAGTSSTNFSALRTSETSGSGSTPVQPTTAAASTTGTNTFSIDRTLAPGASMTLDIYADSSTNTGGTATVLTTLTVTYIGVTSNVSTTTGAIAGQTITMNTGVVTNPPTFITASSTISQYIAAGMGGAMNASKATYNFVSTNGPSTITELKFTVNGTDTVTQICVTPTGGSAQCAAPVGGTAYITGLSLPVPNGGSGLTQDVWVSYSEVGTSGITPGTTSSIALNYVKYSSGGSTTIIQYSSTPDGTPYTDADTSATVTSGDTRRGSNQVSASSAYDNSVNTGIVTFDAVLTDTSDEVKTFGTITTGRTIILTETGAATNTIGAITGTLVSPDGWTCSARDAANGLGSATTTVASIQSVLCTLGTTNQVVLNTDPIAPNAGASVTTITLTTTLFAGNSVVAAIDSDLNSPLSAGGVNAPAMTLVGSKPVVTVTSTQATGLIIGSSGTQKIGEVVVSADAKGNIKINDIAFTVGSSGITGFGLTNNASSADNTKIFLSDSGSTTVVSGSHCGTNGTTAVFCEFGTVGDTFSNDGSSNTEVNTDYDGYTITAGGSKTLSLYAIVGGTQTASTTSIVSTALTAAGFNWDDTSTNGVSGTALTGTLIYNFPTNSYSIRQ